MKRHNPSPATIRDAVCAAFEIAPEIMLSKLREDRVVLPRQAYAYLLRTQGALTPIEVMDLLPYARATFFKTMNTVLTLTRVDEDFARKIRTAELTIIQSSK